MEQALEVSEKDVKDASAGVLRDLKRFQKEKEEDLRRYMVCNASFPLPPLQLIANRRFSPSQVAYARCHLDWARKNLETWTEAKEEVDKIVVR